MRQIFKIFLFSFLLFAIYQCAHPVMPSGGPKDTKPPGVVKSDPPNGSAHFSVKKFTVTFDEFIQLDNIIQKVLISPPMKKLPVFRLKGKSLQVKFMEDLKPNTTYSVYFADAIIDLTERNPLLNYTYILSTGDEVDSMSIGGIVINAFDLKPAEDVYVMLYKDENDTIPLDSLPFYVQPYYLSKTDKNGHFLLNGLADVPYMMFALKDLNANYIYDQPDEEIAFLDSLVWPVYEEPMKSDTSISDSTVFVPDSLLPENPEMLANTLNQDSLKQYESQYPVYTLFLFDERDSTQKLLSAKLLRKNTIQFSFTWPAGDVDIKALNFSADTTWYVVETSGEEDTITWFVKNLPVDTLDFLVMYDDDTLDVLSMRLNPKRVRPGLVRNRKKEKEKKKEYLGFKKNIKGNALRPDQFPELIFGQPVAHTNTDSLLLITGSDSTYNPGFYFIDSTHRKIRFPIAVKEDTRYTLVLPDSSFVDWNGLPNERGKVSFVTKSLRDYGILVVDLVPAVSKSYVLQLLDEKENVKRETWFSSDTTITFNYLSPGKYVLKVIFDENENRKWDSGNYIYKIEPERVAFFPKVLIIRANWEDQEEWKIE